MTALLQNESAANALLSFTFILAWAASAMVFGTLGAYFTRDDAFSKPTAFCLALLLGPGALYLVWRANQRAKLAAEEKVRQLKLEWQAREVPDHKHGPFEVEAPKLELPPEKPRDTNEPLPGVAEIPGGRAFVPPRVTHAAPAAQAGQIEALSQDELKRQDQSSAPWAASPFKREKQGPL